MIIPALFSSHFKMCALNCLLQRRGLLSLKLQEGCTSRDRAGFRRQGAAFVQRGPSANKQEQQGNKYLKIWQLKSCNKRDKDRRWLVYAAHKNTIRFASKAEGLEVVHAVAHTAGGQGQARRGVHPRRVRHILQTPTNRLPREQGPAARLGSAVTGAEAGVGQVQTDRQRTQSSLSFIASSELY